MNVMVLSIASTRSGHPSRLITSRPAYATQQGRRPVISRPSKPFASMTGVSSSFSYFRPTYRFLDTRMQGWYTCSNNVSWAETSRRIPYTFSNSSLTGGGFESETRLAMAAPISNASASVRPGTDTNLFRLSVVRVRVPTNRQRSQTLSLCRRTRREHANQLQSRRAQ